VCATPHTPFSLPSLVCLFAQGSDNDNLSVLEGFGKGGSAVLESGQVPETSAAGTAVLLSIVTRTTLENVQADYCLGSLFFVH
jgi:hypothetical protein